MNQTTVFPRPDFERKQWLSLNGQWDFAFDRENTLEAPGCSPDIHFDQTITVPFSYESALSGIGTDMPCQAVWYRRSLTVTEAQLQGAVLLKFGAVDYRARVWVNGAFAGEHTGGYTPFGFDIAGLLRAGDNTLVVKAEDSYSREQPRGKQMWGQTPAYCWYTNTTGIWQNVWVEFTGKSHIVSACITPDIDHNTCRIEVVTSSELPGEVRAELSLKGRRLARISQTTSGRRVQMTYQFQETGIEAVHVLHWSPEFPNLVDVRLELIHGDEVSDEVCTYFGMRKISVRNDRIYLNNQPLYQRLVLDQGYWKESLLTPPSDDALIRDIELTKAMGFNGARKHQKIEDPRYYYWADKLGLLVWGELPSAFDYTDTSAAALIRDMREFIQRDYNHPCIITWVPLNESWGVHEIVTDERQQSFARSLYHMIKSQDATRLVSTNDGWEQVNPTDFSAIHDYGIRPETAEAKYAGEQVYRVLETNAQFKQMYAEGESYGGEPIIVSEYGGIKLAGTEGWGYNQDAGDAVEFVAQIRALTRGITANPRIAGYCYTQLTDVMQETNGLLDMDRKPKAEIEKLRDCFVL